MKLSPQPSPTGRVKVKVKVKVGKSLHRLNFPVLTSSFRPLFDLPDAPSAVPPTSSEWVPGRPVPVRRLNDRSRTCSLPNCCQAGGRVPLQARKRTTSVQQSSWLSAYVAANDIQSAELEPQVQGSAKLTNCGGSGSQSCSKTGSIVDMTPGTLHSPQLVVLQADFLYGGQDLSPTSWQSASQLVSSKASAGRQAGRRIRKVRFMLP